MQVIEEFRELAPRTDRAKKIKKKKDEAAKAKSNTPQGPYIAPPTPTSHNNPANKKKLGPSDKNPATIRQAAGEIWEDQTMADWPANDYRIFVGNLGNEVNDVVLTNSFRHYSSFAKARVVRCKRSNKSKGYGFVSMLDA